MAELSIFPVPRKLSIGATRIDIRGADWVILPRPCSRALRERIEEGVSELERLLNKPIRIAAALPGRGEPLLEIRVGADLHSDQAFELKLAAGSSYLCAGGEAGAFYGVTAFLQIIEQYGDHPPALTIEDGPDFPARGVMLDISRCKVPTMETCRLLVDRLAGLRINQLQLYTEHTFAFSAHKTVWQGAGPFTHQDILELDQYCADRFIDLVPNLNSFGHFSRWLRHPEYRHLAECPENPATDCLAPDKASLDFLDTLYGEYLPHFRSMLFNVGCDETWELGKGRSKARAEEIGTTSVYLDFIKKIHGLVEKNGRRMQFWGDIILHQPDLIKQLPEDILALCWGYEADHPYSEQCPKFAEAGIEYHVCPGTSAWNSITGRTDNCLANLENAARNGLRHGATGYLITDWGDGGHHQVLPISYLGMAAGAAYSWHLKTNLQADLAEALSRHVFRDTTGVCGQFCTDLGRTLNRLPGLVRGNCSAINQLLFGRLRNGQPDISGLTQDQYHDARNWLDRLAADLDGARPACGDRALVMQELRHALAAARHALHRGLFVQFNEGSPEDLRAELHELVMDHENQWLARNRPGGLYESSTRLRRTVEALEVGTKAQRDAQTAQ